MIMTDINKDGNDMPEEARSSKSPEATKPQY